MATLYWRTANTKVTARSNLVFGRHPHCHVRVDSPLVSGEHASLVWLRGVWELRDLGSRNGTYLNNRRLVAGERVVVQRGAVFSLSRSAAIFEFVDVSPPALSAKHLQRGNVLVAEGGMLALPSEQNPRAMLILSSEDVWHIEMDAQVRPLVHEEILTLGDDSYVLEVPEPHPSTLASESSGMLLESVRMHFAVSPDEEQVDVTLWVGGQKKHLEPREYHYLLVTLARARIADADLPSSLRGWVDKRDLYKKLKTDRNKLNVDIFRARKQLAELAVEGAARLIELRPGTHEIRIGVTNVEVSRM